MSILFNHIYIYIFEYFMGVHNFITLTNRPILIILKKIKSTNRFRSSLITVESRTKIRKEKGQRLCNEVEEKKMQVD